MEHAFGMPRLSGDFHRPGARVSGVCDGAYLETPRAHATSASHPDPEGSCGAPNAAVGRHRHALIAIFMKKLIYQEPASLCFAWRLIGH